MDSYSSTSRDGLVSNLDTRAALSQLLASVAVAVAGGDMRLLRHFDSAAELYRMVAGNDLDATDRRTLAHMLTQDAEGLWLVPEFRISSGDGDRLLEARALAGLFLFDEDIVWLARGREALKDQFRRLRALIEGAESLRLQVKRISAANGEERIDLRSGRRLRFMSGGRSAGRGLSVDCCLLDGSLKEIETLRANLWPCMRSRPNPQLVIA